MTKKFSQNVDFQKQTLWNRNYVFVFREGLLKGVKKGRDQLYVSILEKSTSYRQSTMEIKGVNRGRDQL